MGFFVCLFVFSVFLFVCFSSPFNPRVEGGGGWRSGRGEKGHSYLCVSVHGIFSRLVR